MDYYTKVNTMAEEKLVNEIQQIYKKLSAMSPQSAMYQQLVSMLEVAESAYQEKLMVNRFKNKVSSEVINIGTVDEHVHIPDYSSDELLLAVVSQYIKKDTL